MKHKKDIKSLFIYKLKSVRIEAILGNHNIFSHM